MVPDLKLLGAWLLLTSAGLFSFPAGAESALDFQAVDLRGEVYRPARQLANQVVLIDFWATWCAPCVKSIPTLNQLRAEYGEQGFEVIGVASYSGTAQDVRRFLAERTVDYPIVMGDEDLVERFEVIGYPTYFLIDRQGRVAEIWVGEIESQLEQVERRIQQLVNETSSSSNR